jgi:VIT1/CCC1 family predicted Fe2+/Mn2+ transporter
VSNEKFIVNLRQAWRDECNAARNYQALAERERDPARKEILERMAASEVKHAERWAARLKELGVQVSEYRETASERARRWMLTQSSATAAAQLLEADEAKADALYEHMLGDPVIAESDRSAILEAQREEIAHGKMLEDIAEPYPAHHPQRKLNKILGAEKWHVTAGGWIGQAIYGLNDGLGAAFGVVSGVAGATNVNGDFVLLSGLAAAIASALSMGSGAYLATKSEREVYEAEIKREKREIEENPEEEQEEMELFYQLKGFSADESKKLAAQLAKKPDQLLKALAHEELGLSEQSFPNPWRSAVTATISTAVGAIVPVLPFFFWSGMTALVISFAISTMVHFIIGAAKVLVTGRSWLKSGTEMTIVGLGEALVTYAVGLLIAPMIG